MISEITRAELLVGVAMSKSKGIDRTKPVKALLDMFQQVPITNAIEYYAEEKVRLRASGQTIEDFDLLIACTAVSEGLVMVSANSCHLGRVCGIRLQNQERWSKLGTCKENRIPNKGYLAASMDILISSSRVFAVSIRNSGEKELLERHCEADSAGRWTEVLQFLVC